MGKIPKFISGRLDTPVYDKETKKTRHHYVTVGKAEEGGGAISFGPKYLLVQASQATRASGEMPTARQAVLCGERLVPDEVAA